MKKKVGILVGSVVAAGILGFGIFQTSAESLDPTLTVDEIEQMVTDQYPGTIEELELEDEFNRPVYEVEVKSDGKEYELKLDGHTGEVLNVKEKLIKKSPKVVEHDDKVAITEKATDDKAPKTNESKENKVEKQKENKVQETKENKVKAPKEKKAVEQKKSTEKKVSKKNTKNAVISLKEAEKIALQAFSGKIIEIELDEDDGRLIYEIEMVGNGKEAEIDLDAITGKIIVLEIDEDDDNDDDDNDDD